MAKTQRQRKDQINAHQKEQRRKGRDIAPLPKVKSPKRRRDCQLDLRRFCETYFSAVFNISWSDDHLRVLNLTQTAVLEGGLFAVAMPRGSGKTSIALAATIWALIYGHRSFVALIATSAERSYELLANIKIELETNDKLAQDFPEVCVPIQAIEGKANNAGGQLHNGERTRIEWTQKQLTLPTIPKSCSSGSVVKVGGITGGVRGMQAKRARDGATIRPDLVIIDDPQDDESANSPQQVGKRLKTVSGAILGLAGPKKKIAGIMPITVIAKDDMADRVLDRKKYPQWQGERIKLMPSLPTDEKLWEQYAELRAEGLRNGKGLEPATTFYRANQAALDAGAVASWPARFNTDEASAIQNGMNLKIEDEAAFQAEYQNDPISAVEETPLTFDADQVLSKAVKAAELGRYAVPDWATTVTAFTDVQRHGGGLLYYMVVAFDRHGFTAQVIDYGTYPGQPTNNFYMRDVKKTLARRGVSIEAAITRGLSELSTALLERDWLKPNGQALQIGRMLVDAGDGSMSGVIKAFINSSKYRSRILPSYGRGKDRVPMNDWTKKEGERVGWNWRVRAEGHLLIEVNEWKSFIAQRILALPGDPGSLSLFSPDARSRNTQHKMLADHLAAEYPLTVASDYGGDKTVWRHRPTRDNHLLDCLVGCYAAASEQGVVATGHRVAGKPKAKKIRKQLEVQF